MKMTQKALTLAIIASLASGQNLQAEYRERAKAMAKKGAAKFQEGAKAAGLSAIKTAGQAKQAWDSVDPETKKAVTNTLANIVRAYVSGQLDAETKKQIDANLDKNTKDAIQKAGEALIAGGTVDEQTKKQIGDAAIKGVVGIATGDIKLGSKEKEISDPTGLTERTGAVQGRDILKTENKATLDNIIRTLSSGSFKGNQTRQQQFLGTFGLTTDEIAEVIKKVKAAERGAAPTPPSQ